MLFSKLLIASKLGSCTNKSSLGDVGRIQICIQYLTIMFQASGLHNYALELIELSAGFRHEWSLEFKNAYMDNCLVNISGRSGGWMEVDRYQEHIVRTISDQWNPNGNFSSSQYLREVISVNAMSSKDIKERVRESATGKSVRGKRSSLKEKGDIVICAKEIHEEGVFTYTSGRTFSRGKEYVRCTDLMDEGATKLLKGALLERWKLQSEIRMGGGYTKERVLNKSVRSDTIQGATELEESDEEVDMLSDNEGVSEDDDSMLFDITAEFDICI